MALVTLSGYPCSGKTTRAHELKAMFESRLGASSSLPMIRNVVVVNDESLGIEKTAYDDSRTEKPARANLLSATIRALSKDAIVICDALNYIKGFRYQLYCAGREAGVRMVTVHIAAPSSVCTERSSERIPASSRYSPSTLENLIQRYEEPSAAVRWDSPLVVLPWCDLLWEDDEGADGRRVGRGLAGRLDGLRIEGDSASDAKESDDGSSVRPTLSGDDCSDCPPRPSFYQPPPSDPDSAASTTAGDTASSPPKRGRWSPAADTIWAATTSTLIKPTHVATRATAPSSTSSLHRLESLTSSVVDAFLSALSASPVPYGRFTSPVSTAEGASGGKVEGKVEVSVILGEDGKAPTVATLQRARRQYVGLRKVADGKNTRGVGETAEEIVRDFATYLETTLRRAKML